jgi:hypothetical protein
MYQMTDRTGAITKALTPTTSATNVGTDGGIIVTA